MPGYPFPACDTSYLGRWRTSGLRTRNGLDLIVIHSAEGLSARGVANYFADPATRASTHAVVDQHRCFRGVRDECIPWGAPGANHDGWHIELCGFAAWTRADWLAHELTLRQAAWRCALRARWHRIPLRWLGPTGLRLGRRGFTRHVDVSRAFHRSDHTDPGEGFPRDAFLGYVRLYTTTVLDA